MVPQQPLTPPPQSVAHGGDMADGAEDNKKPLKKSNSRGDILSSTQQHLLSGKNFFETSELLVYYIGLS